MARAGFGGGMRLIAGGKHRPGQQPGKPASKMRTVLREQISRKLVDRNRHHQLGRAGRRDRPLHRGGGIGNGGRGQTQRQGDRGRQQHGLSG